MLKKILLIVIILTTSLKSYSAILFDISPNEYFKSLVLEDDFTIINHFKDDFSILYDSQKEVIFIKHKNIDKTYKISLRELERTKNRATVTPTNDKLTLISFKTEKTTINSSKGECLEVHGSEDLFGSFNVGASSILPLYKAFVFLTGRLQMDRGCQDLVISKSLDKSIGFPLSVSYRDTLITLTRIESLKTRMDPYIKEKGFNLEQTYPLDLNIQYEMLYSLLDDSQKNLFSTRFSKAPISIKIKAMSNLLSGK